MDFNFELILCLITLVTGVIALLDVIFWAPKRKQRQVAEQADKKAKPPALIDFSRSLFPVFLLVLLIRSFLFEPFRIPSGSLEPTLLIGDFVLVNKYDYGLRLPVTHTKFFNIGEPQRGDIVVFRWPVDESIHYIKRVIGVPGDTISYINKELVINGEVASQTALGFAEAEEADGQTYRVIEKSEDLSGVEHDIYQRPNVPAQNFYNVVVPEGKYFVMGDNRDDSADSRYWGFVDESDLVGKAVMILFSIDFPHYSVRFNRIGDTIN